MWTPVNSEKLRETTAKVHKSMLAHVHTNLTWLASS